MHNLPAKYAPTGPVTRFLQAYEPEDRKEARAFREKLMAAMNHYLPPGDRLQEHPDSMYLECERCGSPLDRRGGEPPYCICPEA